MNTSPITGIEIREFINNDGRLDVEFVYPDGFEDEDYYWDYEEDE